MARAATQHSKVNGFRHVGVGEKMDQNQGATKVSRTVHSTWFFIAIAFKYSMNLTYFNLVITTWFVTKCVFKIKYF